MSGLPGVSIVSIRWSISADMFGTRVPKMVTRQHRFPAAGLATQLTGDDALELALAVRIVLSPSPLSAGAQDGTRQAKTPCFASSNVSPSNT